jgi:hypothetical protein
MKRAPRFPKAAAFRKHERNRGSNPGMEGQVDHWPGTDAAVRRPWKMEGAHVQGGSGGDPGDQRSFAHPLQQG